MRWLALIAMLLAGPAAAAGPMQAGTAAHAEFLTFELADEHRAFAVAPGGAWAWASGQSSPEAAEAAALAACAEKTEQTCVAYAVNDRVVFDAAAWPRLWRPYADAATADRAAIGTARGQRFPNLALRDPEDRPRALADLRGQVVVLHFWGSWCGPCQVEMPDVAALAERLRDEPRVRFVLLQVREPIAQARAWMARKGHVLALHDSGATSRQDRRLRLADGTTIPDRDIATLFPTTFVLDKQGVVLFAGHGSVHNLPGYAAFLRDAAAAP